MSQIMITKSKNALIHDILFSNKKFAMNSSANVAKCDVCGKGLKDDFSVTAKTIHKGTIFLCKVHLN